MQGDSPCHPTLRGFILRVGLVGIKSVVVGGHRPSRTLRVPGTTSMVDDKTLARQERLADD